VFQGRLHRDTTKIDVTWKIVDPFFRLLSSGARVLLFLFGMAFVSGLLLSSENYIQTGALGVFVLVFIVRLTVVSYRPSLKGALKRSE